LCQPSIDKAEELKVPEFEASKNLSPSDSRSSLPTIIHAESAAFRTFKIGLAPEVSTQNINGTVVVGAVFPLEV
jgi:hypothetical protein